MITKVVRVSYVNVFEPKMSPAGDMKYSLTLLIPKADTVAVEELQAAVAKAIEQGKAKKWSGKVPRFKYEPIRDGDAELEAGDKEGAEYVGHYFINASSSKPPGISYIESGTVRPLTDPTKLYSGCYCRVDLNPFPYSNAGNNGIGWGLNNVLLIRKGERLDGRQSCEDAFKAFADTDTDFGDDQF